MKVVKFYMVQYRPGESGCPHFLSGDVNHEEWEWPMYVMDPFSVEVKRDYVYRLSDPSVSVDFDFYGSQTNFVSEKFLTICDAMGVRYRAIPLRIEIEGVNAVQKKYFIFLPGECVDLLDRSRSEFSEDRDMETGEIAINNLFPGTPMYGWIRRFVVRADCSANLFRCKETMELVCSVEFKLNAERDGLKGLEFIPIDESYRYDPWGEAS